MATCYRLRAYQSRQVSYECTVVDAICATMASDLWFLPTTAVKGSRSREFAGVGDKYLNPAQELLIEAESHFKAARKVACLLSVGSGRPCSQPITHSLAAIGIDVMARRCESTATDLSFRHLRSSFFHRLSADLTMEHTDLMNLDEDAEEVVGVVTTGFMEEKDICDTIDGVVEALVERQGRATLDQISKYFDTFGTFI